MIKKFLIGNKAFQSFFEKLYRISLSGMNYGRGGIIETSGELFVLQRLKSLFNNKEPVIFDIGSNVGQYATELVKVFGQDLSLYCFEPSARAFDELINNPSIKNAKFFNTAMSNSIGESNLFFDKPGTGWASMYKADIPGHNILFEYSEKIKIDTIDNFCRSMGLNKINFLKIDVEGHELDVLKGANDMLKENRIDIIQFEIGVTSINARIYLRDFFETLKNYTIYRILKNGIIKINYNERYEVFLTSNYLAINNNEKLSV